MLEADPEVVEVFAGSFEVEFQLLGPAGLQGALQGALAAVSHALLNITPVLLEFTDGICLDLLNEAKAMADSLPAGTCGNHRMYFETGQGTALSANAFHGVDQQTCEARAYAVAKQFDPLLVNTVVGFIGPEYLFDGKQIIRAGLEDHFCGKLLGLPMGCDICYTNHAYADQNDMDNLLTLLGVAECSFIMGIPGSDDIMLNYQTTSFHDALYARKVLGLKPAPEFEQWLMEMQIFESVQDVRLSEQVSRSFSGAINQLNKGYSHG